MWGGLCVNDWNMCMAVRTAFWRCSGGPYPVNASSTNILVTISRSTLDFQDWMGGFPPVLGARPESSSRHASHKYQWFPQPPTHNAHHLSMSSCSYRWLAWAHHNIQWRASKTLLQIVGLRVKLSQLHDHRNESCCCLNLTKLCIRVPFDHRIDYRTERTKAMFRNCKVLNYFRFLLGPTPKKKQSALANHRKKKTALTPY